MEGSTEDQFSRAHLNIMGTFYVLCIFVNPRNVQLISTKQGIFVSKFLIVNETISGGALVIHSKREIRWED